MSDVRVASALGAALAPLVWIGGGYLLAKHLKRNRETGKIVKWPIIMGLVLAFLHIVGLLAPNSRNVSSSDLGQMEVERTDGQPSPDFPIKIAPDVLQSFGNQRAELLAAHAKSVGWSGPQPPKETHAVSQGLIAGKTVVRLDTKLENFASVTVFFGVIKGKEVNVACVLLHPGVFKYEGSDCEAMVSRTFDSNGIAGQN